MSISSASAQTRARRTQTGSGEDGSNRNLVKKTASTGEVGRRDNNKQTTQAAPLVRQTALTYPAPAANQNSKRPVLVNDIAVVSSVAKESPVKVASPTVPAGGSAANIPSIWPVSGPLSSGFGIRGNPFGGPGSEFHKGQDISVPQGTPVVATADGTVVIAGWLRGYGWVVYIDHGNGISTRYGHLSRIDVAVGQTIKRGEQLGLSGSTGRSTGPHVHYEVRINGQAVNPLQYLPPITISKAPGEEDRSARR